MSYNVGAKQPSAGLWHLHGAPGKTVRRPRSDSAMGHVIQKFKPVELLTCIDFQPQKCLTWKSLPLCIYVCTSLSPAFVRAARSGAIRTLFFPVGVRPLNKMTDVFISLFMPPNVEVSIDPDGSGSCTELHDEPPHYTPAYRGDVWGRSPQSEDGSAPLAIHPASYK